MENINQDKNKIENFFTNKEEEYLNYCNEWFLGCDLSYENVVNLTEKLSNKMNNDFIEFNKTLHFNKMTRGYIKHTNFYELAKKITIRYIREYCLNETLH